MKTNNLRERVNNMNAQINISNVILETDRLILRAWEITDLDDFFEYASVKGVGEKAGWEHHKSKDKSLEILKMFIEEKKVVDYCFNTLKLNFLMASYFNYNIASKRVLENLNFKFYKDIIIETRYNNIKEKSTLMLLKNN